MVLTSAVETKDNGPSHWFTWEKYVVHFHKEDLKKPRRLSEAAVVLALIIKLACQSF